MSTFDPGDRAVFLNRTDHTDGHPSWHESYLKRAPRPARRSLMVAIPLTDDPSEDPTSVTELIDFIAEHHAEVTFVPTQS